MLFFSLRSTCLLGFRIGITMENNGNCDLPWVDSLILCNKTLMYSASVTDQIFFFTPSFIIILCFRCVNGNYDTNTSNCSTQTTLIDGLNRSAMDTPDAFGSLWVILKKLIFLLFHHIDTQNIISSVTFARLFDYEFCIYKLFYVYSY